MIKTAEVSASVSQEFERLKQKILEDGFVVLRGFFPVAQADHARTEMDGWFDLDLQERKEVGEDKQASAEWHHFESSAGQSDLSRYAHGLNNCWGKSPMLDQMIEKLITDPVLETLFRAIGGSNYLLLSLFCRRMTGERDRQNHGLTGQRWHRDGKGGWTIGILLSDFPKGENGSTKVVRTSHKFPYDPQVGCIFQRDGSPVHGLMRRVRIANRFLERRLRPNIDGGSGERGDVYLFLSETWHGRQANLNGNRGTIAFIGFARSGVPVDDRVAPELLAQLPPQTARRLRQPVSNDAAEETLIDKVIEHQKPPASLSLFRLALVERIIGEILKREGLSGLATRVFQHRRP